VTSPSTCRRSVSGSGGAASAGIATRAAEIGLRRALGARRRHVAAQLLAETTLLGIVGGVLGTLAGTLVTVGVSAANSWVPVLDLRVAVGATALAGLVGLLAGVVPAGRALRVTPVEALCR
jgi:putative ABC transport system permease protein